jgi:hypothetical protein
MWLRINIVRDKRKGRRAAERSVDSRGRRRRVVKMAKKKLNKGGMSCNIVCKSTLGKK